MSRIANEFRAEIASITRLLTEKGIALQSRNPEVKTIGEVVEVGWSKSGPNLSIALKGALYEKIYTNLRSDQQYNFVLKDGSFIQLLYKFNREELVEQRACYYPVPKELRAEQDAEITGIESEDLEIESESEITTTETSHDDFESYEIPFQSEEPPLIRIDHNPSAHEPISHSATHLHLGNTKNCRIPTSAPVPPKTFILFILRSFYPHLLTSDIEEILSDSMKFPLSITEDEKECVHVNIPSQ